MGKSLGLADRGPGAIDVRGRLQRNLDGTFFGGLMRTAVFGFVLSASLSLSFLAPLGAQEREGHGAATTKGNFTKDSH